MNQNIVFILSDQHNPSIMGCASDPFVRTPNLDKLASRGTTLDNCYCPSPLCVPSRAAMLSGQLPSETGIFTNFQSLPSDRVTFLHCLAIAGYENVLCGRMHFNGPDQRHGFSQRLVGDYCSTVIGRGLELGALNGTPDQSRIALEKSGPGNSTVIDYDKEVIREALSFLGERNSDKPLFFTVGLYGPHCPYVCPKDLFDYYYDLLPVPDTCEDFKKTVHPAVQKWYANRGLSGVTTEEVRRSRAAYYGLIEMMDEFIGQLVKKIDHTLGLKNTLLIYASDHGDMIGDKGLFWKSNFYEGSARVPIIFSLPGVIPSGKRIIQAASLLDLGPTLIELSGGPELPRTDGESILSLIKGGVPENSARVIISQLGDVKGDSPSAMIRKGEWKLISHYGYEHPQLFDLADDPEEMKDLAQDPGQQAVREELLNELSSYWNGEEVLNHITDSYAHSQILKRWEKTTEPDAPEQWIGKLESNALIK